MSKKLRACHYIVSPPPSAKACSTLKGLEVHRSNFTAEDILEEFSSCQPDVELALEKFCAYKVEQRQESMKLWRMMNRARVRKHQSDYQKTIKGRLTAKKGRAAFYAKHKDRVRIEKLKAYHKNKAKNAETKKRHYAKLKMNPEAYALHLAKKRRYLRGLVAKKGEKYKEHLRIKARETYARKRKESK